MLERLGCRYLESRRFLPLISPPRFQGFSARLTNSRERSLIVRISPTWSNTIEDPSQQIPPQSAFVVILRRSVFRLLQHCAFCSTKVQREKALGADIEAGSARKKMKEST